jgi:hypothetical protein
VNDIRRASSEPGEVADGAVEAVLREIRAERAAQAGLVVEQAVGSHAALPRQLQDLGLEPVPSRCAGIEHAVPRGGEDLEDRLAVADHDDQVGGIHSREKTVDTDFRA